MITIPRIAAVSLATLIVSVSAIALGDGDAHPHGNKDKAQAKKPAPDVKTSTVYENDIVLPEAPKAAETETVETQDFDINDFLGENGMVDVEKLRAYEAGKMDYIAENIIEMPDEGEAVDIIMIDPDMTTEPNPMGADEYAKVSEKRGKEYAGHTSGGSHSADPATSDLPAKQAINRLMGETHADKDQEMKKRDRKERKTKKERMAKKDRNAKKSHKKYHHRAGGKTVTLSGETVVHIAPNGSVTITNNGEAIVPLSMGKKKTGAASAMIMDNGQPAKVSVKKTVTTDEGKRKVHVEVKMESDMLD